MSVLKPNFFPSVPRLLNKIYQTVMAAADAPGLKGALLRRAIQAKLERLESTGIDTHPLWDRLVFKKVGWSPLVVFNVNLGNPRSDNC